MVAANVVVAEREAEALRLFTSLFSAASACAGATRSMGINACPSPGAGGPAPLGFRRGQPTPRHAGPPWSSRIRPGSSAAPGKRGSGHGALVPGGTHFRV